MATESQPGHTAKNLSSCFWEIVFDTATAMQRGHSVAKICHRLGFCRWGIAAHCPPLKMYALVSLLCRVVEGGLLRSGRIRKRPNNINAISKRIAFCVGTFSLCHLIVRHELDVMQKKWQDASRITDCIKFSSVAQVSLPFHIMCPSFVSI